MIWSAPPPTACPSTRKHGCGWLPKEPTLGNSRPVIPCNQASRTDPLPQASVPKSLHCALSGGSSLGPKLPDPLIRGAALSPSVDALPDPLCWPGCFLLDLQAAPPLGQQTPQSAQRHWGLGTRGGG